MEFSIIDFGIYNNKQLTLAQIIFIDPDWFFYNLNSSGFKNKKRIREEALFLAKRAKNIRIPKDNPNKWRVEYRMRDGEFQSLAIVEVNQLRKPSHIALYDTMKIDMEFPQKQKQKNTRWSKSFGKKTCRVLFGKNTIVTNQLCSTFFNNADNFILHEALEIASWFMINIITFKSLGSKFEVFLLQKFVLEYNKLEQKN